MSGWSTPSRKLSRTTTRVTPPRRRKAVSWSCDQICELERNVNRPDCLAAAAQNKHEQPRAAILADARIADHGAGAVIYQAFFAWGAFDYRARFRRIAGAQFVNKALHALVAAGKAAGVYQVLPDRRGVAATR